MQRGPAITIGNFDGVHCGHQELVRACRERGGGGAKVIVLSFDPHPATVLRSESAPARISTFAQRTRWLAEAGADEVIRLEPSPQLLSLSPEEFLAGVCGQWRPAAIVEGPDFRFGRDRAGSMDDLRRLQSRFGYEVEIIEPVERALTDHALVRVSSSMIRWLLARGRVGDAAILLGRPYEIETIVERGAQRGRGLGFPTANLANNGCLLPADGVYAGAAELPDGSVRAAAISVGTNPTFSDGRRVCEAHLLDFDGWSADYGWRIRLRFIAWLRDQIAFASLDALKAQIERDIARTRGAACFGASVVHS